MTSVYHKVVSPTSILDKTWGEISKLHQQFFSLSAEFIREHMMMRDEVYLFYSKDEQRLVGTVGVQWLKRDETVILYIGNAVIDSSIRRCGMLSCVVMDACKKTFNNYPRKKKYISAFASTPQTYTYCKKFFDCWPKENQIIPEGIKSIMEMLKTKLLCDRIEVDDYKCIAKLSVDTNKKVYSASQCRHSISGDKSSAMYNEFQTLNPDAEKGDQVLCVAELKTKQIAGIYLCSVLRRITGFKLRLKDSLVYARKLLHNKYKGFIKVTEALLHGVMDSLHIK